MTGEESFDECLITLFGEKYMGTANVTESSAPCQPWTSPSIPYSTLFSYGQPIDHFPDSGKTLADLRNYCRTPFDTSKYYTPWCYIVSIFGEWIQSQCRIPYCSGAH